MRKISVIIFGTLLISTKAYGADHPKNTVDSYDHKITPKMEQELATNARKQGLSEKKDIDQLVKKVSTILFVKNRFAVKKLYGPCSKDIKAHCNTINNGHDLIDCLENNRDVVSHSCEKALKTEIGSKPLKEDQLYKGVLLPKGSTFFYDHNGNVIGAIASKNFQYKEIFFKKGQIRFHDEGIKVGTLSKDQYINGKKYNAKLLNLFFHDNGVVENGFLAEDTKIGDVLYMGSTQLELFPDGNVQHGTIVDSSKINGHVYPAGTTIWFNRNGTVQSSY